MKQDSSVPAEERLLRLIRGGVTRVDKSAHATESSLPQGIAVKKNRIPLFLMGVGLLGVGILLYWILAVKTGDGKTSSSSGGISTSMKELQSLTYYLEPVQSRQLFMQSSANASKTVVSVRRAEAVTKYSVVGILDIDGKRQAVLLDKGTQETFHVRSGDALKEYVIEDIKEKSIVLRSQDGGVDELRL